MVVIRRLHEHTFYSMIQGDVSSNRGDGLDGFSHKGSPPTAMPKDDAGHGILLFLTIVTCARWCGPHVCSMCLQIAFVRILPTRFQRIMELLVSGTKRSIFVHPLFREEDPSAK